MIVAIVVILFGVLAGGVFGALVAIVGLWTSVRRGPRYLAGAAVALIALAALVTAVHAHSPARFGNWVHESRGPQELGLGAVILVVTSVVVDAERLIRSRRWHHMTRAADDADAH